MRLISSFAKRVCPNEKNIMSHSHSATKAHTKSPIYDVITLWPHRSLSQRGFTILLLCLGSLAIAIGLGFFLIGAWPVIGFMGLELGVLYAAFRLNYRDGKASEQVMIHATGLDLIRISSKGKQENACFDSHWLSAELLPQKGKRSTLAIRHHHHHHEIGAFLPPAEKQAVKDLINDRLSAARLRA